MKTKRLRPTIVSLLGILAIIEGIIYFVGGGSLLALASVGLLPGSPSYILGVIHLIIGFVYLLLGYGFWRGRSWSWPLGITTAPVSIVESISQLTLDPYTLSIPGNIFALAIAFTIIYYLARPRVRGFLGRRSSTSKLPS